MALPFFMDRGWVLAWWAIIAYTGPWPWGLYLFQAGGQPAAAASGHLAMPTVTPSQTGAALERRLKRRLIGRRQVFFAVTAPGLETLCRDELQGLSDTITIQGIEKGGVAFEDRLAPTVREELARRGHLLRSSGPWSHGRVLAVRSDPRGARQEAAASPRFQVAWAAVLP